MGRIRSIKPEFPQSESMGRISRESRLCFILLWTQADDAGRLRGSSRMLASLLYPYDDDAKTLIDGWLDELEREKCIRRYKAEGDSYLEVINFNEHQKIDRPTPSKLPAFVEQSRGLASRREDSPPDQGGDQGEEGRGGDAVEPPAAPRKSPPSSRELRSLPRTGANGEFMRSREMWLELGIAADPGDVQLLAQVLTLEEARDPEAYPNLLMAAQQALARGEVVNRFWFKDRKFAGSGGKDIYAEYLAKG